MDVYIATEILCLALSAQHPIHVILVSCDGGYAEMIRAAISSNPNVFITVLATPRTKDMLRNTRSLRLQYLRSELGTDRYHLVSISNIRDRIEQKEDGSEETPSLVR